MFVIWQRGWSQDTSVLRAEGIPQVGVRNQDQEIVKGRMWEGWVQMLLGHDVLMPMSLKRRLIILILPARKLRPVK